MIPLEKFIEQATKLKELLKAGGASDKVNVMAGSKVTRVTAFITLDQIDDPHSWDWDHEHLSSSAIWRSDFSNEWEKCQLIIMVARLDGINVKFRWFNNGVFHTSLQASNEVFYFYTGEDFQLPYEPLS